MGTVRLISRVTSWALVGMTTTTLAVGIVAVNYHSSAASSVTSTTVSSTSSPSTPVTPSAPATGLQPAAPFAYHSDDSSGSSDDGGATPSESSFSASSDQ